MIFPDLGRNPSKPFLRINVNTSLVSIVRYFLHTELARAFALGNWFGQLLGLEQVEFNKLLALFGKFVKKLIVLCKGDAGKIGLQEIRIFFPVGI